jgi:hypothetical protein
MLQDRFVKLMLVVIAVLLAVNLVKPGTSLFTVPVNAQTSDPARRYDVAPVKGFQVAGLKDVVAVGDGRSFVVSKPDGFMVYQIGER